MYRAPGGNKAYEPVPKGVVSTGMLAIIRLSVKKALGAPYVVGSTLASRPFPYMPINDKPLSLLPLPPSMDEQEPETVLHYH